MREQKTKEYLSSIYVMALDGPVRGAYLAREMRLSRPTVSVALQTLEKEGYLTVDEGHLVHLTEKGEHLAKASIHETVSRGRDYHEIARKILGNQTDDPASEKMRTEASILQAGKEQTAEVLEALLILSRRYYCVRGIDIAQFLNRNSASLRPKLERLEYRKYLQRGEEGVVKLTPAGMELAEMLYARHAAVRQELLRAGKALPDAEREALLRQEPSY